MSISAANISNAIHSLGHRSSTHPHAPAERGERFSRQMTAAAGSSSTAATLSAQQGGGRPGTLLSSDMLQAIQTIG
jgi:hypothetical protein